MGATGVEPVTPSVSCPLLEQSSCSTNLSVVGSYFTALPFSRAIKCDKLLPDMLSISAYPP